MALKTSTLEAFQTHEECLRAERLDRIAAAEPLLQRTDLFPTERQRIQQSVLRTHRDIEALFAQRDEMEQQSFDVQEEQIAQFNTRHPSAESSSSWDDTYAFVGDLPEQDQKKYTSLPANLLFRRVQDAFVRPDARIVPRSPKSLSQFGIEGIPLDPECIPDDIAQNLELITFPEGTTPRQRWALKQNPVFVERLRKMLMESKTLKPFNTRLLALPDHRLLAFSENVAAQDDPKRPPLKAQVYPHAYSAERKTMHERSLYRGESERLEGIKVQLEALEPLIAQWRKATPDTEKARIESEALPVIRACEEELAACVNVFKRVAGSTLEGIENFTVERFDGERIPNPSAVMAKLVKVRNRLSERFAEMVGKGGHNEEDSQILHAEIARSEKVFELLREKLKGANPEILRSLAEERQFAGLKSLTLRPFTTFAEKILEIIARQLAPALQQGNVEAMTHGIIRVYVIAKFQEVNRVFEQMKIKMLALEHLGVHDLQAFAEDLEHLFASIDIFPDIRVEEYVGPYEQMCHDLEVIRRGLTQYAGQPMDREQREGLFKRFRDHLDAFDLTQIVRELP